MRKKYNQTKNMCGIVVTHRLDQRDATRITIRRYEMQKERGQEGYGFVTLKKGYYGSFYKWESEAGILKQLRKEEADTVLFHHRNPTSTVNVWEAAHPIQVSHESLKYDYYVVHNGSIKNAEFLKKRHDELKFTYNTTLTQITKTFAREIVGTSTFNDSEAFAIEFAREIESTALNQSLVQVSGNIAFVALQVDKETKKAVRMYWGRNAGAPLKFSENKYEICIVSTGKGEDVKEHTLNWFDFDTKKVESKDMRIGYVPIQTTSYGGTDYTSGMGYDTRDYRDNDPLLGLPPSRPIIGGMEWDKDFAEFIESSMKIEQIEKQLEGKNSTDRGYHVINYRLGVEKKKIQDYNTKYDL